MAHCRTASHDAYVLSSFYHSISRTNISPAYTCCSVDGNVSVVIAVFFFAQSLVVDFTFCTPLVEIFKSYQILLQPLCCYVFLGVAVWAY